MKFIFSAQELIDLYKLGNRNIKNEVIKLSKEVLEKGGVVEFSKTPNIGPFKTASSKDEFKKIENILNETFSRLEKT